MIHTTERKSITKRFLSYIQSGLITKPKPNKQSFFKKKADKSLALATMLLAQEEYLDWIINVSYYSMYYNAISLLAYKNIDLENISESKHVLTYRALVFFFTIKENLLEIEFIHQFKESLDLSEERLQILAKNKSNELLASYRNAKKERGKITYELGKVAELESAKTAMRRANTFDRITQQILFSH